MIQALGAHDHGGHDDHDHGSGEIVVEDYVQYGLATMAGKSHLTKHGGQTGQKVSQISPKWDKFWNLKDLF